MTDGRLPSYAWQPSRVASDGHLGNQLSSGIYDALLTEALRRGLPGDRDLYRLEGVDSAEAAEVLASHVGRVFALVLRAPDLREDLRAQVQLSNDILRGAITDRPEVRELLNELIVERATRLLEILRLLAIPLAALEPLPRPTIGLSDNALLVSSPQEPALSSELRRELASADGVDLLCAFVRWSGIRVLLPELRDARTRGVPIRVITDNVHGLDRAARASKSSRPLAPKSRSAMTPPRHGFTRRHGYSDGTLGIPLRT